MGLRYRLGVQYTRIWRKFRSEVTCNGVVIPVGPLPTRLLYRLRREMYETAEIDLLPKALQDPDVPVIELGGGIGVVSTLIDKRLNDETPHLVVEAAPKNADILREVRRNNNAGFQIVEKAYNPVKDSVNIEVAENLISSTTT
ncbi:MAG: hypothetical protein ABEI97_04820, partial [Candidatus Nanohaloarchaea archaeon]